MSASSLHRVWLRPLWFKPEAQASAQASSQASPETHITDIPNNGEELVIGREYVATAGQDRDRPVESVSRRAVSISRGADGKIFLKNTSANFILLYRRGGSEGQPLAKNDEAGVGVQLFPGDKFTLSGDFYHVLVDSEHHQERKSMEKLPTTLAPLSEVPIASHDSSFVNITSISLDSAQAQHNSSSAPSLSASSHQNSNLSHGSRRSDSDSSGIESLKTAPVIRESAKANSSSSADSTGESPPILKSASTQHETIYFEGGSDSEQEKEQEDDEEDKTLSPNAEKPSRKRKEAPAPPAEAAHDDNNNNEEVAPRRSKRQRRELFNLDSVLDERGEDLNNNGEAEFGSKPPKKTAAAARGKRAAKSKTEEKLKEILALFPSSNFAPDAKLAIFYHEECMNHITPEDHLEQPGRLRVVIEAIKMVQETYSKSDSFIIEANSWFPVSMDRLATVHDADYLAKMKARAERMQPEDLPRHGTLMSQDFGSQFMGSQVSDAPKDTFISFGTWNAALLAAGGVCKAVEYICAPTEQRKARNAFVAVRPPGHHAGPSGHARSNTQGFCIINNVAIGAKYAMQKYGLKRVAIVDIDVHAGNGTAECVEKENPGILFISMHCEEAYPFDETHTPDMYNLGPNVVNLGFKANPTRRKFFKLFEEQCLPKLEEFKPELIMISAGFDAHAEDPTGVGALTSKDYIDLTEKLKIVADKHSQGRVISVLEGGYNLDALKQSALAHICALMRSRVDPPVKGAKKSRK